MTDTFVKYETDPTQMTCIVGRTWNGLFAHRYDRDGEITYMHVGEQWWVEIHQIDRPVVPVLVKEILGDPFNPEVTHYGWEDLSRPRPGDENDPRNPLMVQPRASSDPADPNRALMLLGMCFPAGIEAEIAHGSGKLLALRITEMSSRMEDQSIPCLDCGGAHESAVIDGVRARRCLGCGAIWETTTGTVVLRKEPSE